jgi:hypothetical protein
VKSIDQLLLGLEIWSLGGDQPENGNLVSWNLFQGLKGSRTRVVVFEQEPLGEDPSKDLFCENVIAPLQQPPAALIAPSEMKSESDFRVIAYHGVVHFDAGLEPPISAPSLGLIEGLCFWI